MFFYILNCAGKSVIFEDIWYKIIHIDKEIKVM